MKRIKDKKIIVLVILLVIFSISYFVIINKVSYAFEEKYDLDVAMSNKKNVIILCAKKYGENNIQSFNNEGILYITIQDLINNKCLAPNDEGNIIDLKNPKEIMNNKKIRLKNDNGIISADIYN